MVKKLKLGLSRNPTRARAEFGYLRWDLVQDKKRKGKILHFGQPTTERGLVVSERPFPGSRPHTIRSDGSVGPNVAVPGLCQQPRKERQIVELDEHTIEFPEFRLPKPDKPWYAVD